ncbi:hypothetical protein [Puniceibacterium sp. IMCC21224]|uniref:hypothetical protein n=1 Tax=Puniceibacterium sp. IMCC21224 TaxID=1618204 RepID=UPI00064DA350|nr:hypothetical protein [Puniceibacterium sp. IMCC21224]KMK67800.1 hypothetical protein IMCC21224_112675 [Puniceibacterium sp. IMCC21224]
MFTNNALTENFEEVRDFLLTERAKVLSDAEWRFRMRGYGYSLRRTDAGVEIARLPQNSIVGMLDA